MGVTIRKLLGRRNWPTIAVLAVTAAMVFQLRQQGRIWFCECQQPRFWTSETDGSHTSQHLADPYSFTHFQHGLALFLLLRWLLWPKGKPGGRLVAAVAIEAAWEIVENTQVIIGRYRDATAALGYSGDSIANSCGDLLACYLGYQLASRLGTRGIWLVLIVIELGMLVTCRDSLLLSVLMLVAPLDVVKQWQLGA